METDSQEPIIKEYLEEQGVLPRTVGMNLLAECILFWMDTDLEKLLQVTQHTEGRQTYNCNLYVDLAILHDGSIHTVMQHMWDSLSHKQGEPLNPSFLNCFIIKGIVCMRRLFENKRPIIRNAQIIPFPSNRKERDKVKQFVYQEVTERR